MVPRVHHLSFITWFSFHQCYMTSTASDLHGLNDQVVFCQKWVRWCNMFMIFGMQWFLANTFWILVKKFQKSGFLTIQILEFGLFEGMKVSKFFICTAKALNWMKFCESRFFENPHFPGKTGFFRIPFFKPYTWLVRCI
jgi:hypothetical protein